jgi:hypothetical protein
MKLNVENEGSGRGRARAPPLSQNCLMGRQDTSERNFSDGTGIK